MEKKQTDIAKNVSSGAEKVESISKKTENTPTGKSVKTVKKTTKKGPSANKKKINSPQAEKMRAKKRVDAALKKEERKAKKTELKEARKARREEAKKEREKRRAKMREERDIRRERAREKREERLQQAKERERERKAERQARKTLLKNETAKERAARKEKERAAKQKLKEEEKARAYQLKLEKRDAKLKKREQRLKDREHRREKRRTPGFGGWLAAVISLGAVSLVLTSLLTYGALNMRTTDLLMQAGQQGMLYELVGIMDDVDEDLSKVRVSASKTEQSRLLTDLLVQTRLAESNLEKIPLSMQDEANTTAFLNRTAMVATRLLEKLRAGQPLSERDVELLDSLYRTHHEVRTVLDSLTEKMTDKDMKSFMKSKGKDAVSKSFKEVENLTLPEGSVERPPFEETVKPEEENGRIPSARAEELCREYFKDYSIEKTEYAGETISGAIDAYNFYLYDQDGVKLFAEISKAGELLGFNYYKNCKTSNFDFERALAIAQDYLTARGYEDMTAVWASESGAEVDFKFVYDDGRAVYYPDAINVKVCLERGLVSGLDATAYIRNHRGRSAINVKIGEGEAKGKLNPNLTVQGERLCVIPAAGKEIAAYEFVCEYDGTEYYIYLDAVTGEETHIFIVENSKQGRILR